MASNPIRGRLNARLLQMIDEAAHQLFGRRKQALFSDLPDQVVEIGPGSGPNFRYYSPGTKVIAVEPNRHLHHMLAAAARRAKVDLSTIDGSAERIPLANASVDAIVCTLVLCTVPNPHAAIMEIRRVLRPGGKLVFLEHVEAPAGTLTRWSQMLLRRAWHWLFEGCDLTRDTESALRGAGFAVFSVDRFVLHTPLNVINCQIAGTAVR